MKVTEIIAGEKNRPTIIRFAAYCRVSSDSKDHLHSVPAQIRYYKDFEKKRPEYRLVDIYADEGITGTSMEKRDEFNRLIRDCKKGKIDRVVVKSVSRFARNTEELLVTLRIFKEIGVSVYFEEQGIDTDKMNMEMIVTFPGMAAQQESMSISGNMRWSFQKRMQSGEFNTYYPAYGFLIKNGQLEINEPQAEVIRHIFELYLQGNGVVRITQILMDEGIPNRQGKPRWRPNAIKYILKNERYMGDARLQKKYTTETLPFKIKTNHGEQPQFYVKNSNPAIITKEMFEAAQRLMSQRAEKLQYTPKEHPLTKMLICPECGKVFRRQIINGTAYWHCSGRASGVTDCQSRRLKEVAVYEAFTEMMWKLTKYRTELLGTLIHQLELLQNRSSLSQDKIRAIDKRIADLAAQNLVVTRMHNKGILSMADYTTQTDELNRNIRDLRLERRRILAEDETEELLDTLQDLDERLGGYEPRIDFDEELFNEIVLSITVVDSTQVTFKLPGGLELTEKIHEKGRCKSA